MKNFLNKIKEHWITSLMILIAISLISFGIYNVVNGGKSGISAHKANEQAEKQEWKNNETINKYQKHSDYITPLPIVRKAVQTKFGNNFNYAKNFDSINQFIENKFNKNTALVVANDTSLVVGMTTKERNSAIANIKGLTTDEYVGCVSKQINTNLQTGSYTANDTEINLKNAQNTWSQNTPTFFNDNGALVGLPTIITTKSNEADNQYPYVQMVVYYQPAKDMTIDELVKEGLKLDVEINNEKIKPTYTDLFNNIDKYSDNKTLNTIYEKLKNNQQLGILNSFTANTIQKVKTPEINISNAKDNLNKKIVSESFYLLSFEVPVKDIPSVQQQTINVKIDGANYTLTNMKGKKEIDLGNYTSN